MPSAQEKDLNPNTYIGLSFPLRKDNRNEESYNTIFPYCIDQYL